jgi:hypothetical protein
VNTYSLTHLSDPTLLRDLVAIVSRDCETTATMLAYVAEVDARRLYAPAGHPSMWSFCVRELHMSGDIACKRIQAARVVQEFPAVFDAVAEGRLHLTAVLKIGPRLTPANAEELIAAATHKTRIEIETLLAHRFPVPDVPTRLEAIPTPIGSAPGQAEGELDPDPVVAGKLEGAELVPEPVDGMSPTRTGAELVLEPVPDVPSRPRVTPLAPERFALQFTIGQSARDKLRYAQELIGHQLPSGDIAAIFERALDALIARLEKRKFAATAKPRKGATCSVPGSRHIPTQVKRAVWQRDGGRCTFVSATGRRCSARKFLEFNHVDPVARGGRASVSGIRLRCRAHNQLEADRTFGAEVMENRRRAARAARAARTADRLAARATRAAERRAGEEARRAARAAASEVIP